MLGRRRVRQLALVSVAVFLPLIPALRYLQRRQLAAYDEVRTAVGGTLSEVSELVTGAPVVVGLDNGRGGFLTHAAPDLGFGARPEWRYWLDVVEALGLPALETAPAFPISPQDQAAAWYSSTPATA